MFAVFVLCGLIRRAFLPLMVFLVFTMYVIDGFHIFFVSCLLCVSSDVTVCCALSCTIQQSPRPYGAYCLNANRRSAFLQLCRIIKCAAFSFKVAKGTTFNVKLFQIKCLIVYCFTEQWIFQNLSSCLVNYVFIYAHLSILILFSQRTKHRKEGKRGQIQGGDRKAFFWK